MTHDSFRRKHPLSSREINTMNDPYLYLKRQERHDFTLQAALAPRSICVAVSCFRRHSRTSTPTAQKGKYIFTAIAIVCGLWSGLALGLAWANSSIQSVAFLDLFFEPNHIIIPTGQGWRLYLRHDCDPQPPKSNKHLRFPFFGLNIS
ncbi:hypothetical protein B0H12DRAFT_1112172 [Mycena haematopus]|nr:hypothetical protein B0H12DRAFT_1112172 [Mycena haematopus]